MELKTQRLQNLINSILAGSSTYQLAKRLDVSAPTVQNWVGGKYFPDKDNLKKLAGIKGWTLDEMVSYLEGGAPKQHTDISMPALLAAIRELSKKEQATEVIREALAVIDKLPAEHEYSYSNIGILERQNSMCELIKLIQQAIQEQGLEGFCRVTRMPVETIESILNGEPPTQAEYAYLAKGLKVSREEIETMVGQPARIPKTESDPIEGKNNCTNGATNGASKH